MACPARHPTPLGLPIAARADAPPARAPTTRTSGHHPRRAGRLTPTAGGTATPMTGGTANTYRHGRHAPDGIARPRDGRPTRTAKPPPNRAHARPRTPKSPPCWYRRGGTPVANRPRTSRRTVQTPAPSTELICCGSPQTISRAPARPRARGRAEAAAASDPPLTATTTTAREAARLATAASA